MKRKRRKEQEDTYGSSKFVGKKGKNLKLLNTLIGGERVPSVVT